MPHTDSSCTLAYGFCSQYAMDAVYLSLAKRFEVLVRLRLRLVGVVVSGELGLSHLVSCRNGVSLEIGLPLIPQC